MTVPEGVPPRARLGGLRGVAIGVVCLVAVVAILFHQGTLDPARFGAALHAMGVLPLLVGLGGGVGVIALQTLRWWSLTRPVATLRYRDAFATVLVGGLLNTVLPAHAGDVLRVQYLSDRTGVGRATLLGTEVLDVWADKAGWLPAFALFAAMGSPPPWMYRGLAVMLGGAVVLLGALSIVRGRMRHAGGGSGLGARFSQALTRTSWRRLAFAGLGLGALPWVWEALAIQRVAAAAGVPLAALQAFVLLSAFNLASLVPVPGNVGTFEAASGSVLMSFGVPAETAIAFSLVYHLSQLLPYVIGGGLALLVWRLAPAPSTATLLPIPSNSLVVADAASRATRGPPWKA